MNMLQNMIVSKGEATKLADLKPGEKLCKECGQPFIPKGRESYCTRTHYRPCPVCGKPVEAKYLSDPARCCSKECQAIARSNKKKSTEVAPAKPAVTTEATSNVVAKQPAKEVETTDNVVQFHTINHNEIKNLLKFPEPIKPLPLTSDVDISQLCKTTDVGDTPAKVYQGIDGLYGWKQGHTYLLEINKKPNQPYMIAATFDYTDNKTVDLVIPLSSQNSIKRNFSDYK